MKSRVFSAQNILTMIKCGVTNGDSVASRSHAVIVSEHGIVHNVLRSEFELTIQNGKKSATAAH